MNYTITELKEHNKKARAKNKEFFYVGHYLAEDGNYILKVGTTNNLQRRRAEHNRAYKATPNHPMTPGSSFEYDWFIPLSKYNTIRTEDKTKERFKNCGFGEYLDNDRFIFAEKPAEIEITIRKTYQIALGQRAFFLY